MNTKVLKKREVKVKYKRVNDLQNALGLSPLVVEEGDRQDRSSLSRNQLTAASPEKPDNQTPIIYMVDNQIILY